METDTVRRASACADRIHSPLAPVRVAIVEDMQSIAQMLYYLCQRQWGLDVVALAHTGAQAHKDIVRTQPDVILLDLGLPDANGVILAGRINIAVPRARIIVVSASCTDYQLHHLRKVVIHGFVDKISDGLLSLRQAIELVHLGGTYFSPGYLQAARRLQHSDDAFFKLLSQREQEVLLWIAQALSDNEIATQLGMSVATAQTHRREIMHKLDIHSTPKLIRYGIDLGISTGRGLPGYLSS